MRKSDLAKSGDKIKFQSRRKVPDGYNYQQGKTYDGCIIRHQIQSNSELEFIGDDGTLVKYTTSYNEFEGYIPPFTLLVSDEELEQRAAEWLATSIKEATAQAEYQLKKAISQLKAVLFS